jgi:hypothetical protein
MLRRLAVTTALFASAALVSVVPLAAADDEPPVDDPPVDDPPACTVDALLVNSCRPWFGANAGKYPQVGSDKLSQFQYFEQRTGRQMDVVHNYHGVGNNQLDAADLYFASRPDTILFENWALTKNWASADGSNDAVNAQIDQMAASIKGLGDTKIFLTLFHEPENDITVAPSCPDTTGPGTAGTPEQYRAMWANVRSRFDAAGVTNVVWAMDYMNYPPYNCRVDDLYPGDDLVDWIVFDAYQHNNTDVSFVHRVQNMYDLLAANSAPGHDYLSKPWGIVEWGINKSTQQSAYLFYHQAQMAVEGKVFPRLHLYLVFDHGNYDNNDFSHRVAYTTSGTFDPAEQDAFNAFALSAAFVGAGVPDDLTPPTAPADLTADVDSTGKVLLAWTPSSDDVDVSYYEVLRDGVVVGSPYTASYTDAMAPQGDHIYTVRAVDVSGKTSDPSNEAPATVPDKTPPTRPTGLAAPLVGGQPSLTWNAASDNVGVTGYDVLRNGVYVTTTATRSYVDQNVKQGTTYTYSVRARDAAGNVGAASSSVSRTVPDTISPSAPASLTVSRLPKSATITWGPATDNVSVAGYVVYKGTTVVARPTAATFKYTFWNLTSGVKYTYRVAARDPAGHVGPALSVVG